MPKATLDTLGFLLTKTEVKALQVVILCGVHYMLQMIRLFQLHPEVDARCLITFAGLSTK